MLVVVSFAVRSDGVGGYQKEKERKYLTAVSDHWSYRSNMAIWEDVASSLEYFNKPQRWD